MVGEFNFKTTAEIKTSKRIAEQVIGQEEAVKVIRKASKQRRHVLLIGEPGTGKSMLGMALAELLPKEKLVDILSFQNPNDANTPLIRAVPAGKGREVVAKAKIQQSGLFKGQNLFIWIILLIALLIPYWVWKTNFFNLGETANAIIYASSMITFIAIAAVFMLSLNLGKRMGGMNSKQSVPKVIVDNFKKQNAPFFDATGAHAGALLGDVLHDPFQSGGLGTPAHERIVAGMIHKANMGVLFIDEIATLQPHTQQELLTALQ